MPYKYSRAITGKIIIENEETGYREEWTVETLRFAMGSKGLPGDLRAMAREALLEFGLLQEEQEEKKVIKSDTIVTIEGVKIYMDLWTRAFFYLVKGIPLFGSLSDIEKRIRGNK